MHDVITTNRPQLPPAVVELLETLRRRVRGYVWREGLATAAAWLGVAFWIALAIDWFFEPPVYIRAGMLAVAGLVLAWIVVQLIVRRALVRLSDANMALLLERCFPEFQESLLTAVELTGRGADPSECNPLLLERACQQASEPIGQGQLELGKVFNPLPLRRSMAAAVLLVLAVTFSTPIPSLTGIGGRGAPLKKSAKALNATSGRRRAGSGRPSMRSRSIWVEARLTTSCGLTPKARLASPRSLIARSSGPYWNSICSSTAEALSPRMRLVNRQGWVMPSGVRPTGRANCRLPSKRGTPCSIAISTSVSAISGRSTGSRLSRTRIPVSPARLVAMR